MKVHHEVTAKGQSQIRLRTSIFVHPCEWKSSLTMQNITRQCGVEVCLELGDKRATLAEVRNAELSPSGVCALDCISALLCLHVSRLLVWPQFIIYPQLIGVEVTQRNASRSYQPINGFNFPIRCGTVLESIKEAGPLGEDSDLH